ncbi:MAG TPA: CDP-alcohol phosphatidyltransferase family protein [Actinomycetota bacterium]
MISDALPAPSEVVHDRVLTIPNVLSGLRLATVPFFVWLFIGGHENVAVILYAAVAWTDFFDGYIARRTGSVSKLGQLLDPLADRVLIVALAVALVARDALSLWLAVAVIARDVLVLALWPLLERIGMKRIQVNDAGKTATACLLFGLTWLAWGETTFVVHSAGDDVGLPFIVAGAILYWIAGIMYAVEARKRVRELKVVEERDGA